MCSCPTDNIQEIINVCDGLVDEIPQLVGFVRFGTRTSDSTSDLDLWAIYEEKLTEQERSVILERLKNASPVQKVDLFFHTTKEFAAGQYDDPGEAENVIRFLTGDIDPERIPNTMKDKSLLSLYLYSTMQIFSNRENPTLDFDKVLSKLNVTPRGGLDWMHFYLLWFIDAVLKIDDEIVLAKRISKFLPRVAIGYTISAMSGKTLEQFIGHLVNELIGNSGNSDASFVKVILDNQSYWLNNNSTQILKLSAEIRSKNAQTIDRLTTDAAFRKSYIYDAQDLILYLGYNRGAGLRRKEIKTFDPLAEMALQSLLLRSGINFEKIWFDNNEKIIKKGCVSQSLYLIPRFINIPGQKDVLNGEASIATPSGLVARGRGRIIGEMGALLSIPRTADVFAKGSTLAYRIRGREVCTLIESKRYAKILRLEHSSENKFDEKIAKLVEILIIYFAYESISFLRDTVKYTEINLDKHESDLELLKDNPFKNYYVEDFAQNVVAMFQKEQPEKGLEILRLQRGETLFQSGDPAKTSFYIIAEGSISLSSADALSQHEIVLEKNSIFGEASLLRSDTRSTAATAKEDTKVIKVHAGTFELITSQNDKIPDSDLTYKSLLFHLTTINFGRIMRRFGL